MIGDGSASERAYQYTRARILDGTFPGGDLISEGDIAAALKMSRTPVREGFVRLQAERLLRLFPRRGAVVEPVTPREVDEVFTASGAVERWAASVVTQLEADAMADLVARLRSHVAAQQAAIDRSDRTALQEANAAFHMDIVAAAGNSILAEFHASMRARQLRISSSSTVSSARAAAVISEHTRIVNQIERRDPTGAQRALTRHLESTRQAVVLKPSDVYAADVVGTSSKQVSRARSGRQK